jgi:glycosyltransferase involved in cell wall biosynthesis
MTVLQIHCRYRHAKGGEGSVVDDEYEILRQNGHTVEQLFGDNSEMPMGSALAVARSAMLSWWNPSAYRSVEAAITRLRPDIVHVHNTFAALSPSIFWAAKHSGVAVVLTVHNYRLLCANGLLLRDGAPCQECVGRWPVAAVRHRCHFSSSSAIGACIAVGQALHRIGNTYTRAVDAFVALTEFQRALLIRGGFPGQLIHVKPNSSHDFPVNAERQSREKQIVFAGFVGRIKGVDLLLSAWQKIEHQGFRLVIIGDSLEAADIRREFAEVRDVDWRGPQPREVALAEVQRSRWLVLPSRWYEGFPVVIAEALQQGTPILAPNHGCFPEIVEDGKNALLFPANDIPGLARTLSLAMTLQSKPWEAFSDSARRLYRSRYSSDVNYHRLIEIYSAAQGHAANTRLSTSGPAMRERKV